MSLYEMFHSDTNKNYMFDMITKLIKQKHKIDITQNNDFKDYYQESINTVFTKNNCDDITDLNKLLVDMNIDFFESKNGAANNIDNEYEKMLRLRNENITNDTMENDTVINDMVTNNTVINDTMENDTIINDTITNDTITNNTLINDKVTNEDKSTMKPIHINSSKRSNLQSSRYNYKINLIKQKIDSKDIKKLSKLIIPIEKHYLFSLPLLNIRIPELSLNLILQQEKIIEHNDKKHGIYEPIEEYKINCSDKLEKITIDIRDITDTKYSHDDILKINIIEIKNKTIYFTCSHFVKEDFRINDNIKILNIDKRLFYHLKDPLKIKKINHNIIQCHINYDEEDIRYTNIDMKIMNLNNQNLIYFNL
jgi:hypothetical protein